MKKRYLILAFMIIIQFFIIGSVLKNNNDNVYISKKKNEKTDGIISIMLENEDRTGYEESNSNRFPQKGYLLNLEKSKCVDSKGKLVNNKLTYENDAVVLEAKYTSFCYIYFDRIYKISELCNNGEQLGMCLLEHNEDILTLGDIIYSNMYRYNGTNSYVENNYVCFGTDNKNTCLNNKEKYLYRIIGVAGESNSSLNLEIGQIKLIKNETISEQVWYTSNTSDKNWINSSIYSYLQNDFLNNEIYFPSGWLNKVSSVKWKVGTILYNANLEQIDSLESSSITTTNSKIGLIYLSDYLYAHNNTLASDCNSKPCESWLHDNSNYLWTMAYARGSRPYSAWVINQNHFVETATIDKSFSIKPVFYLNSNELYESGNGTIDDPIIIMDKEAPENGSVVINDDADYTTSNKVNLTLNSNGATKMCISETTSCNNWEDYVTTKEFNMTTTLGTKTIYVYYKDDAGNLSDIASDSIKLYEIVSLPTQKGTLTYTASSQTPTWNNYDSTKLTITGTTSGTNATSYTAKFTPKTNYIWSNGTATTKNVTWTIAKAVVSVPSQKGTLIYTGSTISPTWNNYDSAKLTIGGTKTGTNTGSYTAKFTPKTNYMWDDGTTTTKSVTWTITKASGSLSLSKTSVSVKPSASTTVTATVAGNGTITVTSSNTSVATVTRSGNTLTIRGVALGTATITVKVAAGTNHTAPSNKTITVNVINPFGEKVMSLKPTGLNSSTMRGGLYRFYGTGTVNNYVCFGTTNKSTCTSNPGKYMYRIIGITSDNKVKLIKKEALDETLKWHKGTIQTTSADNWSKSDLYKSLNGTAYLNNSNYMTSDWANKLESYNWKYGKIGVDPTYSGDTMYNLENAWIFLGKSDSNPPNNDEWTMVLTTYDGGGNIAWYINNNEYDGTTTFEYGNVVADPVWYEKSVRPVFYLKSSVSYLSGTGTSSSPFIIE